MDEAYKILLVTSVFLQTSLSVVCLLILQQVEVEEERKVPQFVLLVSLNNGEAAGGGDGGKKEASPVTIPTTTVTSATHKARGSSSQGWAVQRTLDDFYALHEKLTQVCLNLTSVHTSSVLPLWQIFKLH